MAFREIRFYIYTGNRETDRYFSKEIYQPFTYYMDALMRGRFKEYSGKEVKGINLVNLCLSTKEHIQVMDERSGGNLELGVWKPMLNILECESEIDLKEFGGSRSENVHRALEIFMMHAKKSDIPQMKTLVVHLAESIGKQSVDDAIGKADEYLKTLY